MLAVSMVASVMAAQSTSHDPLQPLDDAHLTVWVLTRTPPAEKPAVIAGARPLAPITYSEQSAGSFGQSAGSFGKPASSVGEDADTRKISTPEAGTGYTEQTSGNFGQPSSNTGTAASSYGQTASSYGQTSSSYGQAASTHGQTSSSYGHTLSTIAHAGDVGSRPVRNAVLDELRPMVRSALDELQVNYVSVETDELKQRLEVTQGKPECPDVIVGNLPQVWWTDLQARYGARMAEAAWDVPDGVSSSPEFQPQYALLARSPHPQAARLFLLWLLEGAAGAPSSGLDADKMTPRQVELAKVARAAVQSLAHGGSVGSLADPQMAPMMDSLGWTIGVPTTTDGTVSEADDAPMQVQVLSVMRSDELGVVAMRVITSADRVFGVTHPLLVLRRQKDGSWKVLHVSLNLPAADLRAEADALEATEAPALSGHVETLKGITKAAPQDGDVRAPRPELWWDNPGGAGLQVVEWQMGRGESWSDARLFLVPDQGSRLRTRVSAGFAAGTARYRWRVWSVGAKGRMVISSWSTFTVVR